MNTKPTDIQIDNNTSAGVYDYRRRSTCEVVVGTTRIGGNNPIRIQSMAACPTMDTEACVDAAEALAAGGAELVRFTAQGVREAENLGEVRRRLRADGVDVPLVADIHFNPKAAFAAVPNVEKVRINPGNFIDPGRTFRKISYTDEEYALEIERIDNALTPFIELCKKHGTAIRIGVNHGSLSDRIMSRFGDTAAGMVESAMEFLRVCVARDFRNVLISIKSSNVRVMVETVRLLASTMEREGMHFPLHLGVTEAGDGDDGRVKSAVGIGTLLSEGLGDTIRVSLSEDPVNELPVARCIVDYIEELAKAPIMGELAYATDYKGVAHSGENLATAFPVKFPVFDATDAGVYLPGRKPDVFLDIDPQRFVRVDATSYIESPVEIAPEKVVILSDAGKNQAGAILTAVGAMRNRKIVSRIFAVGNYYSLKKEVAQIRASIDLGRLLLCDAVDGIMVNADSMTPAERADLAFSILQAARVRTTRTEYIACPGCGRTLFDLRTSLARVKAATSGLKGLKIGVMGCVVNGPGEMADADYGYVGAGKGKVNLYRGRECVEKNVSQEDAPARLVELIRADGRWK